MPILHLLNHVNADEKLAFDEIADLIKKTSSIDTVIRRVKQILADFDFVVGCSEFRVWIIRKVDWNPVMIQESLEKRTAEIVFKQDVWNENLEEVAKEQVSLNDLVEKSELLGFAQQAHELREAQQKYFAMKRSGNQHDLSKILKQCFELEYSFDKRTKDILKRYKGV